MNSAEKDAEIQQRKSDLIVELGDLSKEFRRLRGDPKFLLYALSEALLAEPPETAISEINAVLADAINPEQLASVAHAAETMIAKLGQVAEPIREHDRVEEARQALKKLIAWITADEVKLLSRPRGHQVRTTAWRYPFFAAVWPHLQAVSKAKLDPRLDWLQQFFDAGDAIKVVDREFVRKKLLAGGLKFSDLMTPAFEISKPKSRGNEDTARSWIKSARDVEDLTLRSQLSAATNAFFILRHKLFRVSDYDLVKIEFTARDRAYAEAAWTMLRDDFGYEQVPSPPAFLLDRCLRSARQ